MISTSLPLYALAGGLPSTRLVQQHIIGSCPAAAEEKCLEASDLLQALGSFYEIVIVVLIALLALVASLVYLSIQSASKRQIASQFEKEFDAEWVQERLRGKVNEAAQLSVSELARRVELLEVAIKRIRSSDQSEDRIFETKVVDPGVDDGTR